MEHTDLFDAFIIENSFHNPSKVNEYLLSKFKSFFKSSELLDKFLFMKCKKESSNLQLALEQKAIIESNTPKGFRFEFKLNDPEDDFLMSTDVKYGLKELFSEYELPKEINIEGLYDIKKYYQMLSEKLGFPVNISDRILWSAGNKLNENWKKVEARRIFEYGLELYPKSLDGLFQVAEMNVSMGRYKEARKYYAEFLKIRSQEVFIQNRLKSIEKFINESAAYEIEHTIFSQGLEKGRKIYQQLRKDNQNHKYFNENEFIQMGYRFLNANKIGEAVEIFKMSVELFPESFNTWDNLGEAYMKKGDKAGAIMNYEKSLELNPENDNAKKMLELLRK